MWNYLSLDRRTATPHRVCLIALVAALFAAFAPPARAQCQAQWLPLEGYPGTNGSALASTVWDPDGPGPQEPLLVVGGSFAFAGNLPVFSIAAWNGSAWQRFGNGTGSTVYALTPYNGDLVVGGGFATID